MERQDLLEIIRRLLNDEHECATDCGSSEVWKRSERSCNCGAQELIEEAKEALRSPLEKVL